MPMTNINVITWEEFEQRLEEVRQAEKSRGGKTDFLFRGLGDSRWPLETTLERAGHHGMAVSEYFRLISRAKPQIESFTPSRWSLPSFPVVESSLRLPDTWNLRRFPDQETYSYMVHLRHHGFPSPLLDWTRSPYVAAFFAFRAGAFDQKRHSLNLRIFGVTGWFSQRFLGRAEGSWHWSIRHNASAALPATKRLHDVRSLS